MIEYRTIEKTGWGPGPWQDEPDKAQWKDEETGLPCLAKRHPYYGHWCGYVGVAEGHHLFGSRDEPGVDVHGGVTYAAFCQEDGDESTSICHIPDPGEPDRVWWIGFDFHHALDFAPGYEAWMKREHPGLGLPERPTYWTLDMVRAQCALVAAQLVEPV